MKNNFGWRDWVYFWGFLWAIINWSFTRNWYFFGKLNRRIKFYFFLRFLYFLLACLAFGRSEEISFRMLINRRLRNFCMELRLLIFMVGTFLLAFLWDFLWTLLRINWFDLIRSKVLNFIKSNQWHGIDLDWFFFEGLFFFRFCTVLKSLNRVVERFMNLNFVLRGLLNNLNGFILLLIYSLFLLSLMLMNSI